MLYPSQLIQAVNEVQLGVTTDVTRAHLPTKFLSRLNALALLVIVLNSLEQLGSPPAQPFIQGEANHDANHKADSAELRASRQRHHPSCLPGHEELVGEGGARGGGGVGGVLRRRLQPPHRRRSRRHLRGSRPLSGLAGVRAS